jgi:hypothetical protein
MPGGGETAHTIARGTSTRPFKFFFAAPLLCDNGYLISHS